MVSPPRQYDAPLMEILMSNCNIPHGQLQTLNKCRRILGIFWLSDLVSVDGKIMPLPHLQQAQNVYHRHHDAFSATHREWDTWTTVLTTLEPPLPTRLGNWLIDRPTQWWVDDTGQMIFSRNYDGTFWARARIRTREYSNHLIQLPSLQVPEQSSRVDIGHAYGAWRILYQETTTKPRQDWWPILPTETYTDWAIEQIEKAMHPYLSWTNPEWEYQDIAALIGVFFSSIR